VQLTKKQLMPGIRLGAIKVMDMSTHV
jgi:hypothetical protein